MLTISIFFLFSRIPVLPHDRRSGYGYKDERESSRVFRRALATLQHVLISPTQSVRVPYISIWPVISVPLAGRRSFPLLAFPTVKVGEDKILCYGEEVCRQPVDVDCNWDVGGNGNESDACDPQRVCHCLCSELGSVDRRSWRRLIHYLRLRL